MPTRVDLPKDLVKSAFEQRIASLKRSISTASNMLVKQAYEHELAQVQTAVNTITEIK